MKIKKCKKCKVAFEPGSKTHLYCDHCTPVLRGAKKDYKIIRHDVMALNNFDVDDISWL